MKEISKIIKITPGRNGGFDNILVYDDKGGAHFENHINLEKIPEETTKEGIVELCRNCGHEIREEEGNWFHKAKNNEGYEVCRVKGCECKYPEPKREKPSIVPNRETSGSERMITHIDEKSRHVEKPLSNEELEKKILKDVVKNTTWESGGRFYNNVGEISLPVVIAIRIAISEARKQAEEEWNDRFHRMLIDEAVIRDLKQQLKEAEEETDFIMNKAISDMQELMEEKEQQQNMKIEELEKQFKESEIKVVKLEEKIKNMEQEIMGNNDFIKNHLKCDKS